MPEWILLAIPANHGHPPQFCGYSLDSSTYCKLLLLSFNYMHRSQRRQTLYLHRTTVFMTQHHRHTVQGVGSGWKLTPSSKRVFMFLKQVEPPDMTIELYTSLLTSMSQSLMVWSTSCQRGTQYTALRTSHSPPASPCTPCCASSD